MMTTTEERDALCILPVLPKFKSLWNQFEPMSKQMPVTEGKTETVFPVREKTKAI